MVVQERIHKDSVILVLGTHDLKNKQKKLHCLLSSSLFFFNVQCTSPLESMPNDGRLVISCHAHLLFSDISANDRFHNRSATYVREGQGHEDKFGKGGKDECIQSCYFMLICRCFLLHKDIGNCAQLALLTHFVLFLFLFFEFSFCLIVASPLTKSAYYLGGTICLLCISVMYHHGTWHLWPLNGPMTSINSLMQ